jgi:hypothetical protein
MHHDPALLDRSHRSHRAAHLFDVRHAETGVDAMTLFYLILGLVCFGLLFGLNEMVARTEAQE